MTKKILVVEDEPASLKILRYFLAHEGYESVGAKDGVEAMELLAHSRFDLVLSDVKMPRLDGVALARHLLSTTPITPIFLMTGYDCDNLDTVLALGVPCLRKPLSLSELLSQIQKVLGHQEQPNAESMEH
jgi:two-component system cell cycle sensor histidine kinase/response regulator CckA